MIVRSQQYFILYSTPDFRIVFYFIDRVATGVFGITIYLEDSNWHSNQSDLLFRVIL